MTIGPLRVGRNGKFRAGKRLAAAVALVSAVAPLPARAGTATWDNGAGTSQWGTPINWASNALPLATDTVWFQQAGIPAGAAIDLGGVSRAVDALNLDPSAPDGSAASFFLVNGTLNLAGSIVEFPNTPVGVAVTRVAPASTGVFGLSGEPTGIDLSGMPTAAFGIGTAADLSIHDTWTPAANTFRVAGGWGNSTLTLAAPDVLTGAANAVRFSTPAPSQSRPNVVIAQPQNFGGGARLVSGTVDVQAPGALGTGLISVEGGTLIVSAAAALDAARLTVQSGALRLARADAVAATAGGAIAMTGGELQLPTSPTPGSATTFDFGVTVVGLASAAVRVLPAADDTQAVIAGAFDVGGGGTGGLRPITFVPQSPELYRSGIAIKGQTTFSPDVMFVVGGSAAKVTTRSAGAFLALDGPVATTVPGTPLRKDGGGTLGLFNADNRFAGVTVNAGAVAFAQDTALGDAGAKVSLANGATLRYVGQSDFSMSRPIVPTGALASLETVAGAGRWTIAADNPTGALGTITSGRTVTLTGTGDGVFAAPLVLPTSLIKDGAGTWTLGPIGPREGSVTINAGTLRVGSPQALGPANSIIFGGAGVLDLGGQDVTVGSLSGDAGGVVTSTAGAGAAAAPVRLTITARGGSAITFAGTIRDGDAPLSVVVRGLPSHPVGYPNFDVPGYQTLKLAAAQPYSGETAVLSGASLDLGDSGALANTSALRIGGQARVYAGTADVAPRIKADIPLTLGGADEGGGMLQLQAPAGQTVRFASLTLLPGQSKLISASTSAMPILFTGPAGFSRSVGSTLSLNY